MIDLTFSTGTEFKSKVDKIMNEQLDKVIDISKGTFHSKEYKKMLQQMAQFHHYSWHNTMLIHVQNPEASYVAGFRRWLELKRYVKRGEKGIAILAPMFKTLTNIDENGVDKSKKSLIGFKKVYVFDIAQTEGEPVETAEVHKYVKARELKELFEFLKQNIEKDIPVEIYKANTKEGGYCNKDGIHINSKISNNYTKKIITLIHEYTHWIIDFKEGNGRSDTPTELKEMIAASVPYIYCQIKGIKGKDLDIDMGLYVAHWSNNVDERYKGLRDAMEDMSKVIRRMIEWEKKESLTKI